MRDCTTFVHFGARQPQGQSAGDDFKCSRAYEVPTAGVKRGKKVTAPGLAIFDTLIASLLNWKLMRQVGRFFAKTGIVLT